MKNILIAGFMLLHTVLIQAQDLHVYYDLHRDSQWFAVDTGKKGLKYTRNQSVGRNGAVHLHVLELNNYLYRVQAQLTPAQAQARATESSAREGSVGEGKGEESAGFSQILSMLTPGVSALGGGGPALSRVLNTVSRGPALSEAEKIALAAEVEAAMTDAQRLVEALNRDAADMITMAKALSDQAQRVEEAPFAEKHILDLQKDRELPPSKIKHMAGEFINYTYGPGSAAAFDLEKAMGWRKHVDQLTETIVQLDQRRAKFKSENQELERIRTHLEDRRFQIFKQASAFIAFEDALRGACDQNDPFEKYIKEIIKTSQEIIKRSEPKMGPEQLSSLYHTYVNIQENRFAADFSFTPMSGASDLTVKVLNKNPALTKPTDGNREAEAIREKTIRIKTHDGLRITGGGGLFFSQYFKPQYTYSVNNGIIVSEPDDQFVPLAATTVNFFSDRGKATTLGAMVGVGLPILSSLDARSITFLLGPSMILGRAQRLSISTGIMGGRTSRLAAPLQSGGDAMNFLTETLPKTQKYEYGWYFGVNFNL